MPGTRSKLKRKRKQAGRISGHTAMVSLKERNGNLEAFAGNQNFSSWYRLISFLAFLFGFDESFKYIFR